MKIYTDIEQSKKLAEILPLESADMCWCNNSIKGVNYTDEFSANIRTVKEIKDIFDSAFNEWDKYWELIPCWSLAALLEVLPTIDDGNRNPVICKDIRLNKWHIVYHGTAVEPTIDSGVYDNLVDACVEMIFKLKEKDLL